MSALLDVTGLVTELRLRHRQVRVIDGVDLKVERGQTLGLVGESGSGKSMLSLAIMGLLPEVASITDGSVRFDGKEIAGLPSQELRSIRGNDISMIFQDSQSSLNPTISVGKQIAEAIKAHRKVDWSSARERALAMMDMVGIPRPGDRYGSYAHELSGGLRQRVMIAIALACEPKLLIADEPTTALDVTTQAQILALLDDLKAQLGMSIILITHDMGVVAQRADRIDVMYSGRIVESGTARELFTAMRHPYTQGLLGSIPRLDSRRDEVLVTIPGLPPDPSALPAGCRFAPRCARALPRCSTDDPTLEGADRHAFACWNPVDGPAESPARRVSVAEAADTHSERESADEDLLVAENLVREFPLRSKLFARRNSQTVKAVSGISLSARRGETVGIVGESGCGKSTLGRLLVGLEPPDSGTIRLGGQVMTDRGADLRQTRRRAQLMFQDPYASLNPRMRVGSLLREPLTVQGIGTRREQDERIQELLREVGLPASAAQRYPHEFSGGQCQRIGLARTLMLEPEVIVADEPVSGLDVSVRAQALNLMKRLTAERAMTAIVISHDLTVVRYLADRIGVLYLGKLVELGTGLDIYERPVHPYTAALLAAIPEAEVAERGARRAVEIRGELPSPAEPPSGCRFRTRCPRAEPICATDEPMHRSFGPEHSAACHFPLRSPVPASEVGACAIEA